MSDFNIVVAHFGHHNRVVMTDTLYQYDYGQKLKVEGITALPQTFQAHFSNVQHGGVSITVTGINGMVDVPNSLLMTGKRIYCWIYVTETGSGETVYQILMPVQSRPMPEYYDVEDVGVFDSVVNQVAEYAATATTGATSATASATAAAGSETAAAASATNAANSAENAAASETNAEASASAAQASDASAATAATTATNKAAEAAQSATSAGSAADRAEAAQEAAETAQEAAETAATSATADAATATAKATAAAASATTADHRATDATNAATTATAQAVAAESAKTTAVEAKTASQSAQSAAETAATNATAKATEAAASATAAAQAAASINTPDSALSDISTNAVQNKVITAELTDVKSAIDALEDAVGGGEVVITPDASTLSDGFHARQNQTGKLVYATTTAYKTVEPIDISMLTVGTEVTMQASLTSNYGVYIADSGLNVLDYVNGNNAVERGYAVTSKPALVTLTVPANAKYITSDIRSAYYTDIHIFDVTGVVASDIDELKKDVAALADNGNVLSNKKWVACGDSFTAGAYSNSLTNDYTFTEGLYAGNYKVYPFFIGRRNPSLTVVNEAISGSTMGAGDNGVNPFSGTRYTAIPEDTDIITLEFGINDSGHGVPIGTIDDADNTTFYGAWNVVLGYFAEHFPFAHIGIIVGPGMQTSNGQQYAQAEIAVAKKWGIPYLNVQFESGGGKIPLMLRTSNPDVSAAAKAACDARQFVNPSSETPNYHPNEKAHEFESAYIEAWLRSL